MLDGAVAVFDGVAGVEPQSETVWRQADKYGVPRICFCNKMDRTGASFDRCVSMIRDRLGANAVIVNFPIGLEADFKGVVDLIRNQAIVWHEETLGAKFSYEPIPADLAGKAAELRSALIDAAVEMDDAVMEAYLEGNEPDEATLIACLRKGTVARQAGAGAVRLGVQEQGRAAAARRRGRLPALAARRAAGRRAGAGQGRDGAAPAGRCRADGRASPSRS